MQILPQFRRISSQRKSGAVKDESWAASKKACLTDIAGFLRALLAYKECIEHNEPPEANFKHIRKYIASEGFDAEVIRVKNSAAAGLCAWVQNIVIYRDIHVEVEPSSNRASRMQRAFGCSKRIA